MGVKKHTPAPGPRRDLGPAVFPPAPPKLKPEQPDDEVADLFEPVTFDWDEDIYQAREAVRRFSEQIKGEF